MLIESGADDIEGHEFRVIAFVLKRLYLNGDVELERGCLIHWKDCVGIRLAWGILPFLLFIVSCFLFSALRALENKIMKTK